MTSPQLKANFSVENKYGAFYTGGVVQMSKDGDHLLCQCGNTVKCLDVTSGKPSSTIGSEEDDEVTCFVLSPDDEILVVASRNLLLKQWNWKEKIVTRTWKAIHTGPVSCMAFDATSTLLATGGADASIKVWDVIRQHSTHNLHGHSGVISVVAFHPDTERLQLVSAGDDYNVRVWSLQNSTCLATLEGHYSVVTGVQFSAAGDTFFTAGRDSVVIVWDADQLSQRRIIPVYEAVEAFVLLPEGRDFPAHNVNTKDAHFVTGGSKGVLRVWNASTSQCVFPTAPIEGAEEADAGSRSAITAARLQAATNTLTVVTYDHNICLHDLEDFSPKKHFVGYNDDVLDMQFVGAGDSHLVVATNSQLVKVFEVATWSCQVLSGHTDIVLCVSVKKDGDLFATGSKDNSIRVWQMDTTTHIVNCVAVGIGHTHAVNCISFSRLQKNFIVSGSHDCTLKVWPVPEQLAAGEILSLTSSLTEHAHEKEINSVVVTPNDKMIASGSQDKTAKLWSASNLSLLGVFRGHKRSIWCVQFSPVDQALVTASADATIKIWSLSDFSCVKTFEGHQSSVLRVTFVTRGMQLLSSGSDGLLKLWTIKSNECVATWDEHDEKVWALAVTHDESRLVTGAGDSTICMWKDVTEEEQQESIKKQEEFILQDQQLSNLLHGKKYVKAIGLAITLNQPFRVLNIFKEMLDEEEGREDAARTLQKLRDDQIDSVLGFCGKWNTNSKHCHVAQFIIRTTLTRYSPEELLKLTNIKTTIESLLPYTERHFQRMNRLQQQSTFVEYTWQSMKFVSNIKSGEEDAESGPTITGLGPGRIQDRLPNIETPSSSSVNDVEPDDNEVSSSDDDTDDDGTNERDVEATNDASSGEEDSSEESESDEEEQTTKAQKPVPQQISITKKTKKNMPVNDKENEIDGIKTVTKGKNPTDVTSQNKTPKQVSNGKGSPTIKTPTTSERKPEKTAKKRQKIASLSTPPSTKKRKSNKK